MIAEEAYLESKVLSADPLELVRILYRAALESVERARRLLRSGEIEARSGEITRALAILTELALSVRHDADAALARNLVELYDYMQRRLVDAHVGQSEPPLAEVSRLLASLLEAWLSCSPQSAPWEQAPLPHAEPAPEFATQGWSL